METAAWRVEAYQEIDSTQDELRRRLADGQDVHALVIRADQQTGGRGQRTRDWLSEPGGSWQSVGLKGHALPASSLFMAIGIVNQLNTELGTTDLQVKWPNDILLDGRKVAGILCEYTNRHLLTGAGVNVRNEVPAGAAALDSLNVSTVNELVLQGIWDGWQMMHQNAPGLAAAYARLDSLRGQQLLFERAGVRCRGVADGVDVVGRLRLVTDDGVQLVDSGTNLRRIQAP